MTRLLVLALQRQRYDVAAHVLVYGLIKARLERRRYDKKRGRRQDRQTKA